MAEVAGLNLLPGKPGIYRFYSKEDTLIYVGKAKDIKKRVSSYFTKQSQFNRKTYRLVTEIRRVEYTVSESEFDALLLENNLIKENQPKYNIQLKDDKSFPYICVVKERFPRIYSTRRLNRSKGRFYGPYTSVVAMKSVLDLIRKLYTIRTCNYNLSEENVAAGKIKVCLEYHIGNCLGPCEGLQSEEDYNRDIEGAEEILKGNLVQVRSHFTEMMKNHAAQMQFEKAQDFKQKLVLLDKFQSKSVVVNPRLTDIHVATLVSDETRAYVNYLRVINGSINFSKTYRVKKKLNEDAEIIAHLFLNLNKDLDLSGQIEILSNLDIIGLPDNIRTLQPQRGDKRKLVEMSLKNALQLKQEYLGSLEDLKGSAKETLTMLQHDLNLKDVPKHIECFDNSNLQGSHPVASMVCFRNGVPAKRDYRHYNIKTVVGPDDFSSMYEIVERRYRRLMETGEPLPNLIVIDGGKGQLNAAKQALETLKIYGKIAIIGIAKRLEEIYFPDDPLPLHIQKKSPSLTLIQRIRDEAHRFAITFHRNKRSKATMKTGLRQIDGVGEVTATKLLRKFKSVKKILEASEENIAEVVGPVMAKRIKSNLFR